ncbi:hypothetical protein HPB50_001108 [Hyalomma asiaticum]|uniref:Uncharacterized protein n=1 Tax=Hyalomma asiaticum TaxID=266040 RepID=A0ACB7S242_HYAAI|nr:hypothetical protein HPB50_001108 [Hyalomma asiaticum]
MAAGIADFKGPYTLSRVGTNRQQFEAAVTASTAESPVATTSQGNLICFDEAGATHEARPSAHSVFEGMRHISRSPLPEFAESREALRSAAKRMVRMDLPTYSGYHDLVSANEYFDRMLTYQQAAGLSDGEVLERVVPVSLTDEAAHYQCRLRRELEVRTQHLDKPLLEYVRAMDEFYRIAGPTAPNYEKVEARKFRDLNELATEAKCTQADMLASRAYRAPPPASQALEPRCSWNGDNYRTRPHDGRSSSGWGLSDRAPDRYTYAMRAAYAIDGRSTQNHVRYDDARMPEQRAPEREHFVERSSEWR